MRDLEPSLLPKAQLDELLPPVSRWTTWGGLISVGVCTIILSLSAVFKYTITVQANALLRPNGEVRLAQATIEGTIQQIAVIQNQQVKQGDLIAAIDPSQTQTRRSQLQESIRQGQQQLSQVANQIQALNQQIVAEASKTERLIAAAVAASQLAEREYAEKQTTTQSQLQEAEASLALAQDERDRYRSIVAAGAVPQAQLMEKEKAVTIAEARLQQIQATLNPSNASVTMAQQQIVQEQAKGESMLASLQQTQSNLLQRQSELTQQVKQDQQALSQMDQDLQKAQIRSPIDGTILTLNLRNAGQFIQAGEIIAQIAPDKPGLVVKAWVKPQDIGKVAIGQPVHLKLSAYPYPDYGTLLGKVVTIAPDAVQTAANPTGKSEERSVHSQYEITIELDRPFFDAKILSANPTTASSDLQAGMEGTAEIVTGEETLLRFFLRQTRLLTQF